MDELPPRPLLPPSMAGAAGTAAGAAVVLEAAWRARCGGAGADPGAVLPAALTCGAVLFALGWAPPLRARSPRALAYVRWLGAGVALAALAGALWCAGWQRSADALEGRSASSLTLRVRGDASMGEYGASVTADALDADGGRLASVRLTLPEAVPAGTRLALVGRMEALDDSDWARSRFMRGEVAAVRAVAGLEAAPPAAAADPAGAVRRSVLAAIDPGGDGARALVAGAVCGRATELNALPVADDFARCGLSHLVAVSGGHLVLISAIVSGALRRTRMGPRGRSAVLGAMMAAYVAFTGAAPSALRSVAMAVVGMGANLGERRAHAPSSLALTVSALVLAGPGIVYDLGFQLSALSVLFIAAFARYLAFLLRTLGVPAFLAEPLALTLCAQWATVPLTAAVFGELSLIAPLANLLVGPLMSAMLVAGLVAAPLAAAVPALGFLLVPAVGLANLSIFCARLLAGVPFASVAVACSPVDLLPLYALAAAAYLLWRPWRRRAMAAALACCALAVLLGVARWSLFAPAAVTVLDVGQADAILVRDGSSTLLIDAGVDDEVVRALARNRVLSLDTVVITHWDRDHWGGLPSILATMEVRRLVVAEGAAAAMPAELEAAFDGEVVELACGSRLRAGGFTCRMVWPREPVAGEGNGDSLCLDVRYDERGRSLSVLLTGDTEEPEAAAYASAVGDVDVLKVGHHGSAVSVSPEILDELEPEVAVASAGEGNPYGHPTEACVEAVEAAGARFLCTADTGDVTLYPGTRGPVVSRARD